MAEVVLTERVAEAGLDDRVEVASCGTGDWHIGHPMDRRAAATLAAAGYDPSRHRAQQFADSWLEQYDVLLAMDAQNRGDIAASTARPPATGCCCSATSILSNPGATCPTRTTVGTAASRRC